jgi:DNA-directed RNA polymerase subunit E'/Rpb7
MKPVSPYRNVEQYTRISIEPYQMNSDIRNYMKINLKKKVEKKCNKNGYVDEVYRIINTSDGELLADNFLGNAIYNISYHCRLCLPIENSIIISQVKLINQELIATINGPIMTFIPKDKVDSTYWDITNNFTHKIKKDIKLKIGDYVLIQIINKRINQNDVQIKTIGKLLDLAEEKDIKEYFGHINEDQLDNTQEDNNFVI